MDTTVLITGSLLHPSNNYYSNNKYYEKKISLYSLKNLEYSFTNNEHLTHKRKVLFVHTKYDIN